MSNSKWAALGAALLASTALTNVASAAEWSATVSGSAELGIAYVDGQDDYFSETISVEDPENIGLVNDSEIHFDFKMVADNGLTFGYHAELNTDGNNERFDEMNAYVSGAFGTVEIGQQDGAYDKLLLTPPGCSFSCPGDDEGYLFDHFNEVSAVRINNEGFETSDALKLSYFTPKFSGFSAGVSFIPNTGDQSQVDETTLTAEDASAWEFGARWQGDLTDDVDLGVSAGYAIGDDNSSVDGDGGWSIAAEMGLFGGSVGGRYTSREGDTVEESSLSLGAEYGTGPWGFFVNYAVTLDHEVNGSQGENDGDWGLSGEVDYDLAPGVVVGAIVEYGAPDEDDADNEFAIGTFMGLSF